jgi:hypothetical protein
MENSTLSKTEIMAIRIADILELIARCDAMIAKMLEVGMDKDTLMIRQEMLIKHRYCEELTEMFQSIYSAKVHVVENELPLPKAA